MTGNIKLADAADADLDLDGPVFINGSVTINTDNTTNDGTIHFESTLDGADGTGDNLIITAGDTAAGASLTIATSIGDTTPLTTLQINESAGTLALTIPQVGGSAAAGVTGQVDIGNANTASISMGAAEYDFGSGNVTLTGNTTFTAATPTVDLSLIHI